MVELSEIALENVVGGAEFKIPQGVKEFAEGFATYHIAPYVVAHDIVASEKNKIVKDKERTFLAGTLTAMVSAPVITIGAYEGIKFVYKKIKGDK